MFDTLPMLFLRSARSCTRTRVAARSRVCPLAADADSPLDQTFGILFSKELNPCPMQVSDAVTDFAPLWSSQPFSPLFVGAFR
jgi:hypothetical protein